MYGPVTCQLPSLTADDDSVEVVAPTTRHPCLPTIRNRGGGAWNDFALPDVSRF